MKRKSNFDEKDQNNKRSKQTRQILIPDKNKLRNPIVDPDVHRTKVETPNLLRITNDKYIKLFDLSRLNTKVDGKRILLLGASGSGKSCCAVHIARYHKDIPYWSIVNPSEDANHKWGRISQNPAGVNNCDDPDIWKTHIERFKERMIEANTKWSIPNTDPVEYVKDPTAALVLDDVCEDPKIFNDKIFNWLFFNSRNFRAWVLITVQYLNMFKKGLRRQFSHVFLSSIDSIKDKKDAHQDFAGMISDFGLFNYILNKATNLSGGWLVIDNNVKSSEIEDRVFFFQHEWTQPPFVLGSEEFRKAQDMYYNNQWKDLKEEKEASILEQVKMKKKGKPIKHTKSKSEYDYDLVVPEELKEMYAQKGMKIPMLEDEEAEEDEPIVEEEDFYGK